MYSIIHNVLLNPFPYTDPQRMVDVVVQDTENLQRGIRGALTIPEFRALVDESTVFEEAVGTNPSQMLYRTEHGTEQFDVAFLTPNSFRFVGVPALIGRTIHEEDTKAAASSAAVLSHEASKTYFGGDPAVLSRKIVLDDRPMNIAGVMPPRFTWHVADLWIPDNADCSDPDAMVMERLFG
jgi:hypothetical protein